MVERASKSRERGIESISTNHWKKNKSNKVFSKATEPKITEVTRRNILEIRLILSS